MTENQDSAGTRANVFINLEGSKGDSGKRLLMHNLDGDDKFHPGMVS